MEREEESFWFSWLGQMIQFGTIKFGRTFKNYLGQFVRIEKKSHHNSRVSLHEAATKNSASHAMTTRGENVQIIQWSKYGFTELNIFGQISLT